MTEPHTERDAGTSTGSRTRVYLHVVAASLASIYPLSLVLRENLGIVPVPGVAIAVILAIELGLLGVLFLILRALTTNAPARLAWLSVFFITMGLYVAVVQQLSALGWPIRPDSPLVAIAYGAVAIAIATLIVRPRRVKKRDPVPLLILGLVLFGTNSFIGVARVLPVSSVLPGSAQDWRPAARRLIQNAADRPARNLRPERDIYYIVLDGFGGTETLRRMYALDLTAFVQTLTSKGFRVVPHASSNYVQTYLSLASTLNLDYLDSIAAAMGPESANRLPLAHLIDHNAMMTLARRVGYRVVGIGSDYAATERMTGVDECACEQYGSSSTEQAMFAATPMLIHLLGPRFIEGHRLKVASAFAALGRVQATDRRVFVFAHLIAPHPPFVFEADGRLPDSPGLAWFQDGSAYPGTLDEYRRGYRSQVEFVIRQLRTVIDSLLSRPGPPPVIVIHGDHGPGSRLDWNSLERSDAAERTGIFAAYYVPNATTQPYDGMTPLNGARLLSNEYFGTDFPLQGDRTYFSTWGKPYDFIPVAGESASAKP